MPRLLLQTAVALILWQAAAVVHAGTPQSITFPEIGVHMTTDAPFALNATASSGLPVSYSIVSTGTVASLSGSTVTLTGTAGSVTVKASQAGDGTFDAAEDVYRSFVVGDYAQRFVKVVSGGSFSAGIRSDGTLWTWGLNRNGQLGDGSRTSRNTPVQVGSGANWASVACGTGHTVAVTTDGKLWAWGRNVNGELGINGLLEDRLTPVRVGSATDWASVACGRYHSAAVKTDGSLWTWGSSSSGQLGDGSLGDVRASPVRVGSASDWAFVACGTEHTAAVKTDGSLWTWGLNSNGQLGHSSGTSLQNSPMRVGSASDWAAVSCGDGHCVAVKTDGTLWAWGSNSDGQLGDGTFSRRTSPVQVGSAANWALATCGLSHTAAVKTDGTLWTWGDNYSGQLGDGTFTNRRSPVQVGSAGNWSSVAGGDSHTVAVKTDGTRWAWGSNYSGQFGNGTTSRRSSPMVVDSGNNWAAVAFGQYHTVALKDDHTLWAWGSNDRGQLGDGSFSSRASPVQAGSFSDWSSVACGGFHTLAIKTDGTLWAWGNNNSGQLGDGTFSDRSSPVQVGTASNWSIVACGWLHTVAIKTDGTLWAWGHNSSGELGDGTRTTRSSPVQVGTASNWSSVACGLDHTVALRNDGTAWSWGENSYGKLGHGSAPSQMSPVQVGSASDWASVACGDSHTMAVKTDGTLWAWGGNFYGQLGDGSAINRSSPVKVGGASNWASVLCGDSHTVATTTDHALWAWGNNDSGQLGDGSNTRRNSPIKVGAEGKWTAVACGEYHTAGIPSDGTLWAWGSLTDVQLGEYSPWEPMRCWPQRIAQSMTFSAIKAMMVGIPQTLDATVNSGLPVHYTVFGPATLTGNVLMPTGIGTVTVTAYQQGDGAWWAVEPITLTIEAALPEIAISGNNQSIANGDMIPSPADHTDFGSVALVNASLNRNFTIRSVSPVMLSLTGTPRVEISGPAAQDFVVTSMPVQSVAGGGSVPFSIRFDPSAYGLRTATVSIANDDSDENPYTFAISGWGGIGTLLSQSITFNAPGTLYLGQSPVALEASASSGLPVALSVLSGPATISGNALTLTGPGTVKVQAIQSGGGNYKAALPVTRTITVKADPTTLTLINLNQRYDGTSKAVGTMGTGDPVTITYKQGTTVIAAPTNAGSYAVTAVAGAATKTGTLVITKAPLFVKADDQRKFAGQVNPELTRTITGFVNGETESVLTRQPVLSTTAVTGSPGGLYAITSSGGSAANYTFIHQRGTMVVESFAGAYEALLADSSVRGSGGPPPDVPLGKMSVTVSATSRSFSGQVRLGTLATALPISGTLLTDTMNEIGTGACTVVRDGVSWQVDVGVKLDGRLTGTVWRNLVAFGRAYEGAKLRAGSVAYAGAHTVVLEPAISGSSDVPAGAGWAKASIASTGVATLTGKLPDGVAFTATLKADAEADPRYRLFVTPYLPVRTDSYLVGMVQLMPHPTLVNRRQAEAVLDWQKTGLPGDASYRGGFASVQTVMLLDPWLKPTTAVPLATRLGLSGNTFTLVHSDTGNSTANGELPGTVTLNPNNTVTVQTPAENKRKWKTTLDVTYGTFTGSFELKDGTAKRTVPFSGVLRQPSDAMDSLIGDGHYLLPPLSGTEKTSGEIRFQR